MNTFVLRVARPVAFCLALFVTAQMTAAALPLQQDQAQQPAPAQQAQPATPAAQPAQQPDANQAAQPAATPAGQPDAPAPAFSSSTQNVEQRDAQNPVGTAVGPYTRPTGVAGSRPAGAAIAPAKQRRVKAIFIRVGLIVAGAAAAGAVIGLSQQSPSRPQ